MLAFVADTPPILWVLCSQKRQRHSKINWIGKADYQNQGKLDSWRPLMSSQTAHTLPAAGWDQSCRWRNQDRLGTTRVVQYQCQGTYQGKHAGSREWENLAYAGQRQKDEKCQKCCDLNHLNIRISWGPFLKDKIQVLQPVILVQLIRTNWTLKIYFWQAVKVYLH